MQTAELAEFNASSEMSKCLMWISGPSKHFIGPIEISPQLFLSRWTEISYLNLKERDIPEVGEPLDQLGGVVLVELDVGEVHLDDGGAGVADPEEHQLGLPQVHRGQRAVLVVATKVVASWDRNRLGKGLTDTHGGVLQRERVKRNAQMMAKCFRMDGWWWRARGNGGGGKG